MSGADDPGIPQRLRDFREAIAPDITQSKYAEDAGLSQNQYNQYETGRRRLTLDPAIKLCDQYGLTLDYIYRNDLASLGHGLVEKLTGRRRAQGGRR